VRFRVLCKHAPALVAGLLFSVLLVGSAPGEATAAPSIRFQSDGLDKFVFHGRVALLPPTLGGPIDPVVDGFGVELSNEFGVIYQASLQAGDLEYMGKLRYRFRDENAKQGTGSRNGLFHIFTRFRQYSGVWYYTVRIVAYDDLSFATEPVMTTKFFQVGKPASITVEWVKLANGWRLPLSRFPDDRSH